MPSGIIIDGSPPSIPMPEPIPGSNESMLSGISSETDGALLDGEGSDSPDLGADVVGAAWDDGARPGTWASSRPPIGARCACDITDGSPSAFIAIRSMRGRGPGVVVYRGASPPPRRSSRAAVSSTDSARCSIATAWRPSGARIRRLPSPCGVRIDIPKSFVSSSVLNTCWSGAASRLGMVLSPDGAASRGRGGKGRAASGRGATARRGTSSGRMTAAGAPTAGAAAASGTAAGAVCVRGV